LTYKTKTNKKKIHPGRLTWNLKMTCLLILEGVIPNHHLKRFDSLILEGVTVHIIWGNVVQTKSSKKSSANLPFRMDPETLQHRGRGQTLILKTFTIRTKRIKRQKRRSDVPPTLPEDIWLAAMEIIIPWAHDSGEKGAVINVLQQQELPGS